MKGSMLIPILIFCLKEIVVAATVGTKFSQNSEIKNIGLGDSTNSSYTSNACHFYWSLEDVARLMRDSKTNVINLNVWIELPDNDTSNKNRSLLDNFQWANKVGRTLYSMMLQPVASQSLMLQPVASQSLILSLSAVTLSAGLRNVDVLIYAENASCMQLFRNDTSIGLSVSLFLLRQMYLFNEDDQDYQLCVSLELKLSCCTMEITESIKARSKHGPVCSYYSSIVTDDFPIILLTITSILIFIAFPLILDYSNRFKNDGECYMITDSPMALSFLLHMLFIEGRGPIKTSVRRLLIVSFVVATILPVRDLVMSFSTIFFYVLICPWAPIFLFSDEHELNEGQADSCVQSLCYNYKNLIQLISLPFNLNFWWDKLEAKKLQETFKSYCYCWDQQNTTKPQPNVSVQISTPLTSKGYGSIPSVSQRSESNNEIWQFIKVSLGSRVAFK
ncbi:uncharacterized protein LOC114524049 [Dendronephthya gigantea]|uniref:uncharacterized protein LOC114524049 n=1 Tax=Dendronephthya gigantea TaxID=151771 RepID=UPI00106CAAEB|nr:uncharacterized protein LOC114524049 [Dendronephthya gigantea]